jgi:ADP-ribosylglycohydrolase
LIGGAIGDAMGRVAEGYSRQVIQERFGKISGFLPHKTRKYTALPGTWTDDTHLSVLTARSILEKRGVDIEHLTETYTQALNHDLGIAGTTRRALELRADGQDVSKLKKGRHGGAGAAARIAPVALFEHQDLNALRVKAEAVSRITHQDEDAVAGAVCVATTIAWAVRGELNLITLLMQLEGLMHDMKSNLAYNIALTRSFLKDKVSTADAIEELGSDGYALRLIPGALYAFVRTPHNFDQTILDAVNAGGDADTRAAIAGLLSGAYNGLSNMPVRWVKRVQDHNMVVDYADGLHDLSRGIASEV